MSYDGVIPVFCSWSTVSNAGVSSLLLDSNMFGRFVRTWSQRLCEFQYAFRLSIQKPSSVG